MVGLLSVTLAGACDAPVAAPPSAGGELIAHGGGRGGAADACFACHGFDGEGDGTAPRLEGQVAGYLLKQMDDYASERRRHPEMSAIAARLRDQDSAAVVAYYAAKAAPAPQVEITLPLYANGDPARRLRACADCHGALGEGSGLANPRLAGLSKQYIADQLQLWKRAERRNDPDDAMGQAARALTDREIDELATAIEAVSR